MALTGAEEQELLDLLEQEAHYNSGRKLYTYFPDEGPLRRELYAKHMEFFRAGVVYQFRLLSSGNRVGKTEGFGCEFTYHLIGDYPHWWEGKRFDHPIVAWAAGDTNPKTQEILQAKLFGTDDCRQTDRMGTGIIPRDRIKGITVRPGVAGAILSARISNNAGGESNLTLKSFEQGIESFQGNEVHVVWADELMPLSVYSECVIRITPTAGFEGGIFVWTVTPAEGLTDAIQVFMPEGTFPEGKQEPPRFVMGMEWDDVPHLSEEAKAVLEASIPAYQLDARKRGLPMLGAGIIYPVPEEVYLIDPFEIPKYWRRAYALDVGWERTAALWGALDPETGIWYLYSEHYRSHEEPSIHAAAIRARGEWMQGVIDPAARGRSQYDGNILLDNYRDLGLKLAPAKNAVESGLYDTWERLSAGRIKVFSNLENWRREKNMYRRDMKGRVIKVNDHLMDCMRYLIASGVEVARQVPVPAQADPVREMFGNRADTGGWMR